MHALKMVSHLISKRCRNPIPILAFHKLKQPPPHRKYRHQTNPMVMARTVSRYYHEDMHNIGDDADSDFMYKEQPVQVKNILYPDSDDPLIEHLNAVASLQEVFDFLGRYDKLLAHTHLAHAVLVLWDLQKMFCHINVISNVARVDELMGDYVSQLVGRPEFRLLLELIEARLGEFDLESLACTLLYLSKIGVSEDHPCTQALIRRAKKMLGGEERVSLTAASRYLVAIFRGGNISAYSNCQDLIPKIFAEIDSCGTANDLKLLTICLNNLNRIVTEENLQSYKNKVQQLINNGVVNKNEPSTIIKIILFLNFPHWRNKNNTLMSQCISLLKNTLNLLNVYEILIIYEIFYKIQEPASILIDIQRCAYKFLHQLEEEESPLLDVRLKLLSCIVCFSSPAQRPQFESTMRKYMAYPMSGDNLLQIFNTLFFLKNSDTMLCKSYWDKMLHTMEHNVQFKEASLLKVCFNYINFSHNVNFRHFRFEKRLNQWLEGEIEEGVSSLLPSRFASIVAFLVAYGKETAFLSRAVNKLEQIFEQLNYVDCLNLSKSLQIGSESLCNPILKRQHIDAVNRVVNKCLRRRLGHRMSVNEANLWLKSCIHRNEFDDDVLSRLIANYEDTAHMSSKLIKNIAYCLSSTSALFPNVIDAMADYVCEYKDNMLAFNVENVAYLCYALGYTPRRRREFFEALQDVLLRDQERLSGLCYLQSCIALCHFNYMTDTFIRQIFNTGFLEKLDTELINCYSKDIYPLRVRYRLMELNRMICIDYPECNVPWFHEKYVADLNKKESTEKSDSLNFPDKIFRYLRQVYREPARVTKNVVTHYGYRIDYVVQPEHCRGDSGQNLGSKLAVLLLRPKAFTKINVQLKGYYQQKIRHLEMFGYRVSVVNLSEWKDLVCVEDRVNYLLEMTSPKVVNVNICEINR